MFFSSFIFIMIWVHRTLITESCKILYENMPNKRRLNINNTLAHAILYTSKTLIIIELMHTS